MKSQNPYNKNKYEIIYHLINASMAGMLVLLGSLSSGNFTKQGVLISFMASMIVLITKFHNYWKTQEKEYKNTLLNFI